MSFHFLAPFCWLKGKGGCRLLRGDQRNDGADRVRPLGSSTCCGERGQERTERIGGVVRGPGRRGGGEGGRGEGGRENEATGEGGEGKERRRTRRRRKRRSLIESTFSSIGYTPSMLSLLGKITFLFEGGGIKRDIVVKFIWLGRERDGSRGNMKYDNFQVPFKS